jgi:hypothetical protein
VVFWEGLMVFWKVWWLSHVVYLYTGVRLSNWNGRVKCEMSGSEQKRKALKEVSLQGGISSSVDQDHAGRIYEVLQADGIQVCTDI